MGETILQNWQFMAWVLTTAVGVGITLNAMRNTEARLARIEEAGTHVAQETARKAVELERRVERLEDKFQILDRLDERTDFIVKRLERMEERS